MANHGIDKDELALPVRLIDVGLDGNRVESLNAQFLGRLPIEGLLGLLSISDVASDSRIPVSRQEIFGKGAFLQINPAKTVYDVQMDYGM